MKTKGTRLYFLSLPFRILGWQLKLIERERKRSMLDQESAGSVPVEPATTQTPNKQEGRR